MDHDARHLNSATADLLVLSVEERIRAIRADRWVQYPRARQALGILRHVLEHPRTTRMPSVAIYGDSGMGKTMIMESSALIIRPTSTRTLAKPERPSLPFRCRASPASVGCTRSS